MAKERVKGTPCYQHDLKILDNPPLYDQLNIFSLSFFSYIYIYIYNFLTTLYIYIYIYIYKVVRRLSTKPDQEENNPEPWNIRAISRVHSQLNGVGILFSKHLCTQWNIQYNLRKMIDFLSCWKPFRAFVYIYIYIYIYILSSRDRLFRCITTCQCG